MYSIIRRYMNHPSCTMQEGLTLEEAREHCSDPDSSSSRCTTEEGIAHTAKMGPWFDSFEEE